MAAQLRIDCNSGGHDDDGDALALSLLHDLLGVAALVASHPLHAAYVLFFSRYLLSLLAFFCPLLLSTSLLVVVLVTVTPYVGCGHHRSPEKPGARRCLGRTSGIAVSALCAELRPVGGGAGLVGQLCSFVLGPADAASVLRLCEIMGELYDITGSCFQLEEKGLLLLLDTEECNKLAIELPLQSQIGEKIFLDHVDFDQIKDGFEEKNVVSEDLKELKCPDSYSEHFCPSESFVQEMERHENDIQEQRLSLPDMDGVSDGVEEKRLECDPVSMEIKKCEPVKSHSSVSRRIRQWEAQVSGNFKQVLEDMEDNPVEFSLEKVSFKDGKEGIPLEAEACAEKFGENLKVQEISSVAESVQQQEEHEFKDVKESVQLETETFNVKYCKDQQAEGSASTAQPEQELQEQSHKDVQPEPELQEQECKDVHPEQKLQEQDDNDAMPGQELQEQDNKTVQPEPEFQEHEYNDEQEESTAICNGKEYSLKSTSIARRLHSRTTSENLVSEGSPRKDKEWKRTLACKLYEERMQLKLCRDRTVVGCSDNMDMLWEAYEVGGSNGTKCGGGDKAKGASKKGEFDEEGEQDEEEGEEEDDEGSVRQLCCLQALKFSTRKMNFVGGKPSLAKISKVLKRMTALSRVGSRRDPKG